MTDRVAAYRRALDAITQAQESGCTRSEEIALAEIAHDLWEQLSEEERELFS